MYSDPHLDAPPPPSQFRRPWSPDVFDPNPTAGPSSSRSPVDAGGYDSAYPTELYAMPAHHHRQSHRLGGSPDRRQQQRREPSDVSVEALDLADYARTLRSRQAEDPYPPFLPSLSQEHEQDAIQEQARHAVSLSSFPAFPRPSATNSRDTHSHSRSNVHMHPPSVVSRGPTLSSNATQHTHTTLSSTSHAPRRATHRPFSLPSSSARSAQSHAGSSRRHMYIADGAPPARPMEEEEEIDISRFPRWSRNWYTNTKTTTKYNHTVDDDDDGMYTSIPGSHLPSPPNQQRKSHFDPGYVHDPYSSDFGPPPPLSSMHHGQTTRNSSRDLLPWSTDPPEYGHGYNQPPLDPLQKAERMRMLEREFGADPNNSNNNDDDTAAARKLKDAERRGLLLDAQGRPVVGTADLRGRLVTVGPRRRVAARALQVLLAAGAGVPVLYAAVAIKQPEGAGSPPPQGKPPVLVLYVLAVATLRKAELGVAGAGAGMPGGMMVLPMLGGGGAGKKKAGKKGGKKGAKGGRGAEGDVQVNLIVDPKMFRPSNPSSSSSASEDEDEGYSQDDEGAMPGQFAKHEKKRKRRRQRQRRRRGLVEGLAMEARWRMARAWAKKLALLDAVGVLLWGAEFVFIMTGKRCPSGGFAGWCNAYNVSSASACLLCVAFGVSLFFDVQDLHASKQSPRTRNL
ncbi:hypothetical protein JR316_0003868 [Psilocybe cubensis]|uniref:Uncharacterized protein n=1 Tax=Psilocybe cubensis TaxID=181762 RepID=A0ACB8H9Q4_PSICU|nr:hypothetical protein JR316_0003868 [Psilocybe cubensis]KAH9484387.1 hypothetical protein JR316_0003868 [Psilocybe cubensis]